jgi:hypothetical protein
MAKLAQRALSAPVWYSDDGCIFVLISGQSYFIEAGSLTIDSTIGRRSAASFRIVTFTPTHFRDKEQVAIYDGNTRLAFSGYIQEPEESPPGFSPTLEHQITCCDQHWLAEKRRVTVSFQNKTPGYMVWWIWYNILQYEGVTIGKIEDGPIPSPYLYPSPTLYPGGGVAVANAIFNYAKVSDAYDALAKKASEAGVPFYWQIDELKQLWFVPYTSIVNSTLIDGTQIDDGTRSGIRPRCKRANPFYRNTQYATGGVTQTVLQDETRIGDGNTPVFTFSYEMSNIAPTLTVNGIAKNVGVQNIDIGKDFYYQQGSRDIVQDSSGTKLTSGDTLRNRYYGQYESVFLDQDDSQIALRAQLEGNTGIVEDVIDDPSIADAATGLSVVGQQLTLYCKDALIFTFATLETGFDQGQLVTVTNRLFGFDKAQMLIEDVSASDSTDGFNIWYTVTAIQGPFDQNWAYFWSKLANLQVPSGDINVGVTQAITILGSFAATIAPTATLTTHEYTLPVPSPTLYPSSTLYPG